MEDERQFREYGTRQDSTIHLVLRLRGGPGAAPEDSQQQCRVSARWLSRLRNRMCCDAELGDLPDLFVFGRDSLETCCRCEDSSRRAIELARSRSQQACAAVAALHELSGAACCVRLPWPRG
jgi:hypothetical protein